MGKGIYKDLGDYVERRKSRREFMQTVSAMGLSPLAANSLMSYVQDGAPAGGAESGDVVMMEGTAGELLVAQLRAAGIKYVFHTNTSGVAPIMDAIDKADDINVIMVTHEGQCVSSAHGYAMGTGELAFVHVSSDGIDHVGNQLHSAWDDTTPLIVSFTSGPLTNLESYSAWTWVCQNAQSFPEMLRRGIKFAVAPPGAPVTMVFPGNMQGQKVRAAIHKMPSPVKNRPVFRASKDLVEKTARWLVEARNPVFVVGREVSRGNASAGIQALAEKLAVPVYQSHRRDCIFSDFPTDHPLFLGDHIAPQRFPEPCDLFVSFGALLEWSEPPAGARVVHISFDARALENSTHHLHVPVYAEVGATVADLTDAVNSLITAQRAEQIRASRYQAVTTFATQLRQARDIALKGRFNESPMSWERVGFELEQALDRNAIIVPELGSQDMKLQSQLTMGPGHKTRLGRSTCGQLGWGLGAAFGASLAYPDRQTVSILGDGGILFGQTETLWSISRYDAPLIVIVMNNHSYNETRIRNVSNADGIPMRDRKDMTSYLGKPDVDFAKIAEGYGIEGEKVRDPEKLGPAIQRAIKTLAGGRPFMLDLEVTRDGFLSESTWYPEYSIAQQGRRRA
jgi:thiamine pyrophosphate-dependent acetolactate synthase large subunit-like protein